ncbi:TonB-dependent receptor plug domain-containing protein [Burkholderia thailandensis]|uniref:TonB-dependent receptor plug domain-containing protein n=1 Tax=Burkholderia thailandensis TaxID=57975 RepID=UPI000517B4AF|nr:TonB-dependent receptor [Burkholderia thailandensis]AIT21330.1 tonB dependent receptor family protein [Burkholderia thailandensis E254]AVR09948.1 TonB-dependent receptor [Burkholderia thailandensis]KIS56737.1 tonB dependent receptor family protein [Burkholderia thailandensis Phuket 4W-1]MCS6478548.1 TonB-dependent receptor [Burkholderia thailandensis]MCS6520268.1 TonB-dependent receptor [Burkholderia thailandensis]
MRTPLVRAALAALSGLPCIALARGDAAASPPPSAYPAAYASAASPSAAAAPAADAAMSTTPAASANAASFAFAASGASEALSASPARSRPASVEPLAPIVVTAQRGQQKLADAIPQTTLFDAQDIADSGATDLPGLLALAPGAQIVRNGGPGASASLFLRGAQSTQSLVLIDGVRIDSASLGRAQIDQLPLDQIERVEVVNGNVSSLYGSGAIGGVVQVFTKNGGNHPPRFDFSVGYGSYHTQTQSAGASGRLDEDGKTTFSVSLARLKTDGFSALDPARKPQANPNANGFLSESASASLRHRFSDKWDAGVTYFQANGRNSYDDAYGSPTDLNDLYSRVQQLSAFANGKLADWWTTRVNVSSGKDRSQSALNGAYTDHFNSGNRQYTWQNDFTVARGHKIQAGYERLDQSFESNRYSAPDRHVNSGWLGYTGRLGDSQFQANVRRDQYSDFGGANSYFLGYGFDVTERWKVSASYSSAFRAPSFNDLYYPNAGNLAIKPERSHSVEAAVQYASDAVGVVRVTAFQTRYTNLIDYRPGASGPYYVAQNVGRAKVQGVEGSWQGHVGKTDVRVAATLQNPIDETAGQDLNRRARRFASISAHRSLGGWRVGGEWLVSGPRDDFGDHLGGYGVVNLSARYDITKSWYVSARIDNLFDKDYELAYAYNTPRRGAYITLGWQQR